jgi:flagellar biosynthesis/type III secretory pathway chaperone
MEEMARNDEEQWNHINESLDMLFNKVGVIETNQQKLDTRFDMTTKVFEQILKDQQSLAKQLEVTGNAVATLTINQMRPQHETPPNPTSLEESLENIFHNEQETSKANGRQYK